MEDWKHLFSVALNPVLSNFKQDNGNTIPCAIRDIMVRDAGKKFEELLKEHGLEISPIIFDVPGDSDGMPD
jgi:hypothetical protein